MMYNPPETEAERTMNELWVARRRQEVRMIAITICIYIGILDGGDDKLYDGYVFRLLNGRLSSIWR